MTTSPSASFYAMSDDDEGEYNSIHHTTTGKGVKLLFSKSKVFVHATPSARDNIPGFIALIQQKSNPGAIENSSSTAATSSPSASASASASASTNTSDANKLLLAWVPESSLGESLETYVKVDLSDSSSPPKQTYLVPAPPITTHAASTSLGAYAFSTPVSNVYSLTIRPPSIGWWYGSVIINTRAGDSFPALFFHDDECQSTILQRKKLARESFDPFQDGAGMFWGGDEVLRWLKRYVHVERAGADPNIYLINPSEIDRKGFGKTNVDKDKDKKKPDASMDSFTKMIKETRWNVLEKFAQLTVFTRKTAQSVAENPRVPSQVRNLLKNQQVQDISEEYDSARIYLARWAMQIAEQSDKEKDQRVWSARDVHELENTGVGDFEILELDSESAPLQERRKPIIQEEWDSFFHQETGLLQITPDEVKEKIFHGGLDEEDGVRKEAWLFLLGVYDWNSSKKERQVQANRLRDQYIKLKGKWWEKMVEGTGTAEEKEKWREERNKIEKDVHRTDRHIPLFEGEDIDHPDQDSPFADSGTNVHLEQMKDMLLTYNEYNTDLGYVQGMSDLLSPIYAVLQDDAIAFWAFVKFMDRMERNFLRDQSGMRLQLLTLDHLVQFIDPQLYLHLQKADSTNFFYFFRMLLVWYKREFPWMDILRLWEVLWTDYLSSNFHIFIALAILERHRSAIMDHLQYFDEILKYINELSNTIPLDSTILKAEALFRRFHRMVEAVDRKNTFPAPLPPQSLHIRGTSASDVANSAASIPLPSSPRLTSPFNSRATPALIRDTGRPTAGGNEDSARNEHGSKPSLVDQQTSINSGSASKNIGPAIGKRSVNHQSPIVGEVKKGPVTDVVSKELRSLLRKEVSWKTNTNK